MSLLLRILLFVSSYFPLTVILAVQLFMKGERSLALLSLVIGIVGIIGIFLFLISHRKINPFTVTVTSWTRKDEEAMSYLVTYLLPFIVLPTSDTGNGIGLAVFLAMLCILYVNSGMIHINPTLNLAGWHLYEVVIDNGDTHTLLTRSRVRRGKDIPVVKLSDNVFLEVNNGNQENV